MYAMAVQEVRTSRSVPLSTLQSFRNVLGEKEKHEAIASEASLRSQVERKRNDKGVSNKAAIFF